ncbi:MAG: hypothetical protein O2911_08560, partial [Bacteroidetes bacterium]|nr:hypothetical protein [Bacteroidota bacterium]
DKRVAQTYKKGHFKAITMSTKRGGQRWNGVCERWQLLRRIGDNKTGWSIDGIESSSTKLLTTKQKT